jgi:putative hydrolase of the HAD superfamily
MCSTKGIIFDYGGTIDTNGIHWGELIWEEYRNAGISVGKEVYRDAYVHGERSLAKAPIIEPTDTFRTLLKKKTALQFAFLRERCTSAILTAQKELEVAERCYKRVLETLAVTRPVLEELSGRYPMVLVTNFYGNMPVVLDEFGLDKYFIRIVESSVVGIRKPDPALFALGVRALGLAPEEIVVIGDSYRKDIYPSLTLGCRAVWLKKICWAEENEEPGFEATATIDTLTMVPGIITGN